MKVIIGWLVVGVTLLLGFIGGLMFVMLLEKANVPLDYITLVFFLWNFALSVLPK